MRGYVMYGPFAYYHASAGVRAWFALASALRKRGCDVEVCTGQAIEVGERIAIYCDTTHGNPLESERIARWLLYYPGFFGVKMCDGDGITFAWADAFSPGAPLLQLDIIERRLFHPDGATHDVTDSAYYVGKGLRQGNTIAPPADALAITHAWPATRDALAEFLRGLGTLYVYDSDTMLTAEAHACGCRVILPDGSEYAPGPEPDYAAMLDRFIALTQERWPS